tara:strand:+ start:36 stop:587 length:552 start_codon:yes stop_codon:yes gene_type:complete
MLLEKAPNYLLYFSLFNYSIIFISEKLNIVLNTNIKKNLLIFIYLFETFLASYFKKTIFPNWKIKHYIQHHFIGSICIILGSNLIDIIHFKNMTRYVFLINIIEITRILQNFNLNNKILFMNLLLSIYYCINLIYYEIMDTYGYLKKYNKNILILLMPIIFSFYHTFILLPILLRDVKKLIKI